MVSRFNFILLALSLFCSQLGFPQARQFSNKEGLSQSEVYSFLRDSRGFMWIGTRNGLNKFDGFEFTNYYPSASEHTLKYHICETLREDKYGRIWIYHDQLVKFISVYDYESNKFYQVDLNSIYPRDVIIRSIKIIDNHMVVSNSKGVITFPIPASIDEKSIQALYSEMNLIESSNTIIDVEEDKENVYFLTFSQFIKISKGTFFNKKQKFQSLNVSEEYRYFLPGYLLKGFVKTNSGNFFFYTEHQGILHFNVKARKIVYQRFKGDPISKIVKGPDGKVWVANNKRGIFSIQEQQESNIKFLFKKELFSIPLTLIRTIAVTENILWVGTIGSGLLKHPLNSKPFKKHFIYNESKDKERAFITSMYKQNDKLYLSALRKGIMTYELETQKTNWIPDSDLNITCLLQEPNQTWVGGGNGLFILKNDQLTKVDFPVSGYIISICRINEHTLWLAAGRGLYEYNEINKTTKHLITDIPRFNGQHIALGTNKETILLSTKSDGLIIINRNSNDGITYKQYNQLSKGLLTNSFKMSYQDSDGYWWIASQNGLYKTTIDKLNLEIVDSYNLGKGNNNPTVNAIIETDKGQFWGTTDKGLFSLNSETKDFKTYTINDGLHSNEFRERVLIKDGDTIYAGGNNGFTSFNYKEINSDTSHSRPTVTRLSINDRVLENVIDSNYNLNYNQNALEFDFTSLHYVSPGDNKFAYKLEGYDKDWVFTSAKNRVATYTNLPPGNYQFKIKSSNQDDHWTNGKQLLYFNISPPFWKTNLAYSLYTILFICTSWFFINYRVVRVTQKRKLILDKKLEREQDKLNEYKIHLLEHISHDLKTPLALIIDPINRLLRRLESNDDYEYVRKKLFTVKKSADLLNLLTSQIIDFNKINQGKDRLNIEEVDLIEICRSAFELFVEQAESRKIGYSFSSSQDKMLFQGDSNKLLRTMVNLISNAFKYSKDEAQIKVNACQENMEYQISVYDTGKGIHEQEISSVFEMYYTEDSSSKTNSFGLGLFLSKKWMNMHGGNIEVKNNSGPGCTFIIKLPQNG